MTWRVSLLALRTTKARCTTTSAPSTSPSTEARSSTSPRRYSVRFQPCAAGSNGPARHADDPPDLARALERADEARPISPVGPVTATVRPAISPSVAVGGADDAMGPQDPAAACSSRSPSTSKQCSGAWAHRQARPGSIGAPTGSASMRTRPVSRSARPARGRRRGSPPGPRPRAPPSGGRRRAVQAPVPRRRGRPRARGARPRVPGCARNGPRRRARRTARARPRGRRPTRRRCARGARDVDVRAAAVLDLRRALHEDHRRRLGEEHRHVRVGDAVAGLVDVATHDSDVDAALGGVIARRQRPDDGVRAAVDRHELGRDRPFEDLENPIRERPPHPLRS